MLYGGLPGYQKHFAWANPLGGDLGLLLWRLSKGFEIRINNLEDALDKRTPLFAPGPELYQTNKL